MWQRPGRDERVWRAEVRQGRDNKVKPRWLVTLTRQENCTTNILKQNFSSQTIPHLDKIACSTPLPLTVWLNPLCHYTGLDSTKALSAWKYRPLWEKQFAYFVTAVTQSNNTSKLPDILSVSAELFCTLHQLAQLLCLLQNETHSVSDDGLPNCHSISNKPISKSVTYQPI